MGLVVANDNRPPQEKLRRQNSSKSPICSQFNMIKIILADDHLIVRNGIKMLLESQHNLSVVGEASNGKGVLRILERGDRVDIVLTDINMVGMGGMELLEQIRQQHPHIKVIMLSMLEDVQYVQQAFEKGVCGYLVKNTDYDELLFAIQHVAKGGIHLCGQLTMSMLKAMREMVNRTGSIGAELSTIELSERETEILQHISEGYTNAEIAEKLFLSKRTVEGHRQNLINRLHVKNSAELIKIAVRHGMVT